MKSFFKLMVSTGCIMVLFSWAGYLYTSMRGSVKMLNKTWEGNNHQGKSRRAYYAEGKYPGYYNSWISMSGIVKKTDSLEKKSGKFVLYHYRDNRLMERAFGQCDDCEALCEKGYRDCLD